MIAPVMKLKCRKCGHEWQPRNPEVYICPACKTSLDRNHPTIVIVGSLENFEVEERKGA